MNEIHIQIHDCDGDLIEWGNIPVGALMLDESSLMMIEKADDNYVFRDWCRHGDWAKIPDSDKLYWIQ